MQRACPDPSTGSHTARVVGAALYTPSSAVRRCRVIPEGCMHRAPSTPRLLSRRSLLRATAGVATAAATPSVLPSPAGAAPAAGQPPAPAGGAAGPPGWGGPPRCRDSAAPLWQGHRRLL